MAKLQPKTLSGKNEIDELARKQAAEIEREQGRTRVRVVRPRREVSIDEGGINPGETPPPAPRVNAADIPTGAFFSEEMGILFPRPTPRKSPKKLKEDVARWDAAYDSVQARLAAIRELNHDAPALAELEALDRRLRVNELAWLFRQVAQQNAERRARAARRHAKFQYGEQLPWTAEMLRAGLERPEEGPPVKVLDELIPLVRFGAGKGGGLSVERAAELADLGARDPEGFRRELARRSKQKARLADRRRRAK